MSSSFDDPDGASKSDVSGDRPDGAPAATGALAGAPAEAPASWREPRNCTVLATTSTFERLEPSCASQLRKLRRPSMATCRPLLRYWAQLSPWPPQTTMSKKFGFSIHSPASFLYFSFTASPRVQTDLPLGVVRSSGSRVRFPTRTTRLI